MRSAAVKIAKDLKEIHDETIEGVLCQLEDNANLFKWKLWIQGPDDSPYQDGIFQAAMTFPEDYPMSPPSLKIQSEFWHPNVFPDGRVCISILHAPGHDPHGDERPEERWLPTQTVATIMLSFLSLLSDPNIFSPANVDASVEWRDNREAYKTRCAKLVEKANALVPSKIREQIPHPDTDPLQRLKRIEKQRAGKTEERFSLWDDESLNESDGELIDFDQSDNEDNEGVLEYEEDLENGDVDISDDFEDAKRGVKRKRDNVDSVDSPALKKREVIPDAVSDSKLAVSKN